MWIIYESTNEGYYYLSKDEKKWLIEKECAGTYPIKEAAIQVEEQIPDTMCEAPDLVVYEIGVVEYDRAI